VGRYDPESKDLWSLDVFESTAFFFPFIFSHCSTSSFLPDRPSRGRTVLWVLFNCFMIILLFSSPPLFSSKCTVPKMYVLLKYLTNKCTDILLGIAQFIDHSLARVLRYMHPRSLQSASSLMKIRTLMLLIYFKNIFLYEERTLKSLCFLFIYKRC